MAETDRISSDQHLDMTPAGVHEGHLLGGLESPAGQHGAADIVAKAGEPLVPPDILERPEFQPQRAGGRSGMGWPVWLAAALALGGAGVLLARWRARRD